MRCRRQSCCLQATHVRPAGIEVSTPVSGTRREAGITRRAVENRARRAAASNPGIVRTAKGSRKGAGVSLSAQTERVRAGVTARVPGPSLCGRVYRQGGCCRISSGARSERILQATRNAHSLSSGSSADFKPRCRPSPIPGRRPAKRTPPQGASERNPSPQSECILDPSASSIRVHPPSE
jgi:hypothetical protein